MCYVLLFNRCRLEDKIRNTTVTTSRRSCRPEVSCRARGPGGAGRRSAWWVRGAWTSARCCLGAGRGTAAGDVQSVQQLLLGEVQPPATSRAYSSCWARFSRRRRQGYWRSYFHPSCGRYSCNLVFAGLCWYCNVRRQYHGVVICFGFVVCLYSDIWCQVVVHQNMCKITLFATC